MNLAYMDARHFFLIMKLVIKAEKDLRTQKPAAELRRWAGFSSWLNCGGGLVFLAGRTAEMGWFF